MIEHLKKILTEMETWTPQDGDIEMAHGEADELLVAALMAVSDYRLTTEEIEIVQQIVKMYERVPKWYA